MATPRPEMAVAITATIVNCAIGAFITGSILCIELISMFEHRHELSWKTANKRWRITLCLSSLFAFCVFLLDGMLVWKDWTGDDAGCRAITIPHVLFYFFEKQSMNHFLYDRAKIVHESLALDGTYLKYLKIFRTLLWLVVVVGVPVFFYWSAFLAFTGIVMPETNCVFYVIYPQVPITIASADCALAIGMLLIFLIALSKHVKTLKSQQTQIAKSKLDKVIRRNLIFSVIGLTSGFFALTILSILEWIANEEGTSASDYLRVWASFTIAFDNFIGVVAIHCMTSGWLPSFIQKRLYQSASTVDNTGGDRTLRDRSHQSPSYLSNSKSKTTTPKVDVEKNSENPPSSSNNAEVAAYMQED